MVDLPARSASCRKGRSFKAPPTQPIPQLTVFVFKKSSAFRQRMVGLFQRRILLFQRLVFPRQFSGANCIGQDRADGWRWNVDIFGSAVRKQRRCQSLGSLLSPGYHPQRYLKRHAVGEENGPLCTARGVVMALRDDTMLRMKWSFRWQVMPLASC